MNVFISKRSPDRTFESVVNTQRSEYKKWLKGADTCITRERIDQLQNVILGIWVATQRSEYKKRLNGVHSQLTQERIDQ